MSAMLIIPPGKVWYQSRFLRSDTYKKNMAANRIVVSEFGTVAHPDPCKTWFQRYVIMAVLYAIGTVYNICDTLNALCY